MTGAICSHPDIPDELGSVLERFLSIDTTSDQSNLELLDHVSDYCRDVGLPEPTRLTDPSGTKANLLVSVPAHDGRVTGGVMFLGHTDTVPVKGQAWSRDPFTPWMAGDRIHGRGTADMKAFCACVVAALPTLAAKPLKEPVHLVLTYEEELGCLGAREFAQWLADHGPRPDVCVVGEPTMMKVIRAHKSGTITRVKFRGVASHSSYTNHGCNAVEYAARAIAFLRDLAEEYRATRERDDTFTVPYSTINVGSVIGGIAVNIVPEVCQFEWETRTLSEAHRQDILSRFAHHLEHLQAAMEAEHPAAGIESEVLAAFPALVASPDDQAARGLLEALGYTDEAGNVSYGTEAGLIGELGIPTVVCGPGSIEQAHRADEYVDVSQVRACFDSVVGLAEALACGRGDRRSGPVRTG